MITRTTVYIERTFRGKLGGAIFSGIDLSANKKIRCIARQRILITEPRVGDFYYVEGIPIKHEKYGIQLVLSKCDFSGMPSPAYISILLSKHPTFRGFGLGERKIDKLIIGSGDEECLIKALDDGDVKLLSKYLAMPKAEELCKRWAPLARETHLTRFFVKYKIPFYLYYSISNAFQESAYDEIKNNPYILVAFFPLARSAWSSIDSIGKQLGISVDSDLRLIGAIEFLLYLELDLGKTAITRDEITERLIKLLKNKRLAVLALQIGIKHRVICSFYASDGSLMVQSLGAAAIESNLATMLRKQAEKGKCRAYVESFTSSSEFVEKLGENKLSKGQNFAVRMITHEPLSVLNKCSTTHKKAIMASVASFYEGLGIQLIFLSLNSLHKQRLEKVISRNQRCYTICEFISEMSSDGLLSHTTDNVGHKLLITVDDSHMVDASLANRLMMVLAKSDYKLCLIGDSDQLTPVGFGVFFHTLVNVAPTFTGKLLQNSADISPVQRFLAKVQEGQLKEVSEWNGETEGVYFLSCDTNQKAIIKAIVEIVKMISCQIISPHSQESMPDNIDSLNKSIQFVLNGGVENKDTGLWEVDTQRPAFKVGNVMFLVNDPVVVTRSNSDLALFTGDSGVIKKISQDEGSGFYLEVEFDGKARYLNRSHCLDLGLQLAYAISAHKSQASLHTSVISTCAFESELFDRSYIYNVLSRSKKLVIFVGSKKLLSSAIQSERRSDVLIRNLAR